MDETTFRILDALTRNLGRALSIQELTQEIRRLHGSAYYANTYRQVQTLRKRGLLQLQRTGRAAALSLNLHSYALLDYLTETELHRKRAIMAHDKRAVSIFEALERTLRDLPIQSACTIDTERNLRLNRIELLILTAQPDAREIPEALAKAARLTSLRIDHLALSATELTDFLSRDDRNPLPEMTASELALYLPQRFWATVANAASQGRRIHTRPPTEIGRLGENNLAHNLARFGYPLLGRAATGEDLSVETTIAAALLSKNSRHRAGTAVLLAKNDFHPRLLAFLALKHGVAGELLGLLGALKPRPLVKELRKQLERAHVKPVKPDTKALRRTMEVYDATE